MNSRIPFEETERQRIRRLQRFERSLWQRGLLHVAGVDEAGRGPLAGPVVAAAVMLSRDGCIPRINDSKKLSAIQREQLFDQIHKEAVCVSVGIMNAREIDEMNILRATHQAMRQAIETLTPSPEFILIDGTPAPSVDLPSRAIVSGDTRCYSIAAASIVAKVTRDRLMLEYDTLYPGYGFAMHKGYGTRQHVEALREFGPSPIHRASFRVSGWQ